MSLMTKVIILGSVLEKNTEKLEKINKWLKKEKHAPIKEFDDSIETPTMGGEKVFTSFLLIGCFNYLNIEKFLGFLKNIKWEFPEHIRVLLDNDAEFGDEGYKQFKIV